MNGSACIQCASPGGSSRPHESDLLGKAYTNVNPSQGLSRGACLPEEEDYSKWIDPVDCGPSYAMQGDGINAVNPLPRLHRAEMAAS